MNKTGKSIFLGFLLIPVNDSNKKRYVVATPERKFVSGFGEYSSKKEAKSAIRKMLGLRG